jgi:hypothetical protein
LSAIIASSFSPPPLPKAFHIDAAAIMIFERFTLAAFDDSRRCFPLMLCRFRRH